MPVPAPANWWEFPFEIINCQSVHYMFTIQRARLSYRRERETMASFVLASRATYLNVLLRILAGTLEVAFHVLKGHAKWSVRKDGIRLIGYTKTTIVTDVAVPHRSNLSEPEIKDALQLLGERNRISNHLRLSRFNKKKFMKAHRQFVPVHML